MSETPIPAFDFFGITMKLNVVGWRFISPQLCWVVGSSHHVLPLCFVPVIMTLLIRRDIAGIVFRRWLHKTKPTILVDTVKWSSRQSLNKNRTRRGKQTELSICVQTHVSRNKRDWKKCKHTANT